MTRGVVGGGWRRGGDSGISYNVRDCESALVF